MLSNVSIKVFIRPFLHTIGVSQTCYSQPGCIGDIVETPGSTVRDCCAGTNDGLSYSNSSGVCIETSCVGKCTYMYIRMSIVHTCIYTYLATILLNLFFLYPYSFCVWIFHEYINFIYK